MTESILDNPAVLGRMEEVLRDAQSEREGLGLLLAPSTQVKLFIPCRKWAGATIDGTIYINIFGIGIAEEEVRDDFMTLSRAMMILCEDERKALAIMSGQVELKDEDIPLELERSKQRIREELRRTEQAVNDYLTNVLSLDFDCNVPQHIRHELDHLAFDSGPLGKRYQGVWEKIDKIYAAACGDYEGFVTKIPDKTLRTYLELKVVAETCAAFFNLPGDLRTFNKRSKAAIQEVKEIVSEGYISCIGHQSQDDLDGFFVGIDEDNRGQTLDRCVKVVGAAYTEDPSRLKRAYSEARPTKKFYGIANEFYNIALGEKVPSGKRVKK